MPEKKRTVIIAYIPVLHAGYLQFFAAFPKATHCYIIDRHLLSDETIQYLRKDLRQLSTADALKIIAGLERFAQVNVLNDDAIQQLDNPDTTIAMPDEDISHALMTRFTQAEVKLSNIFLRWDRRSLEGINTETENASIESVKDIMHIENMQTAIQAANLSTDIWRRVGAVLVLNEKTKHKANNTGEPTLYSPWIEGDPRNVFSRGVGIEMSVFTHAEAMLIARAAKYGQSLDGASLYVTDFPCPACAKLIAHSGITHLYYKDGYAVLDGERILQDYDVSIAKVIVPESDDPHPEVWVPYNKP